jgi:neutral ceramidase
MPLYAGVCEANITPPPGVWMGGYAGRGPAVGVHDELYAHALVLDNGQTRIALVVADLVALPYEDAMITRQCIASDLGTEPGAVMLHCTHTHGGPYAYPFRGMGEADKAYTDILHRKLIGVARQAGDNLQPARLTYGESSAQIGVNRRQTRPDGRVTIGKDYGGPVSPLVQVLCVNGADGRTFALLFSHACHPVTLGADNRLLTADWPGAAVAHLKERFRAESAETGIASDALPFCLQGCCADINPIQQFSWEAMRANGRAIADAAHTARWNAHGHVGETLDFAETTLRLPLLPPPAKEELERLIARSLSDEADLEARGEEARLMMARAMRQWAQDAHRIALNPHFRLEQPFTVQKLALGGVNLLGFPAEMFVQYQLDFTAQSSSPLLCLGYTNGCWGYLPTRAEYERGGYEVDEAYKYYGTLNFAPDSEPLVRQAVEELLSTKAHE